MNKILEILKKILNFRFLWDIFMVNVVIVNLTLILFDLTYLRFRPYYFQFIPKLVEIYDPVLGIEGHRITDDYILFVEQLNNIEKFKDKDKLNEEIKNQTTQFGNTIQEILENHNPEEINNYLKELETASLIEDNNTKLRTTSAVFKNYFNANKGKLNFDNYTKISQSIKEFDKLIAIQSPEGRNNLINEILQDMDEQMVMIIKENPFAESAQANLYKEIQSIIKGEYKKNINPEIDSKYRLLLRSELDTKRKVQSTAVAFAWFWRNEKTTMEEKIDFFNKNLRLKFEMNYYRKLGMDGKLYSIFWKIDAPFFIFFLLEFIIRWYISIHRKEYIAWFLYPFYNWYDVLGLIPMAEFRLFRLLRVYSMFLMLQKSEYTSIGNDVITRTIRDYSNIIKEELSDMVTIQILTDSQNEIKSGSSMEVLTNALDSNKEQIKEVVIKKLSDSSNAERIGKLISDLLTNAVSSESSSFKIIPGDIKEKFTKDLIKGIFETMGKLSGSIIQTETGKETIRTIIDLIIEEIKITAKDPELNKLNQDITIDLLENVKKQVAVKKWVETIYDPFKKEKKEPENTFQGSE
ncbi:MAG: hypothetical protein KDK36_06060 [Leptospiraceae bacterium]|nr:hypothetical protein [Leptospiraceae bacterium]